MKVVLFCGGRGIRLRELSLTWDMPPSWVKFIGGRSAALTLTGRNLALWTDFTSWDPENATAEKDGPNYNFVQQAQPRQFLVRVNLNY